MSRSSGNLSDDLAEENLFASMKHEINRLSTFIGRWPLTYAKPEDLAGNGFFLQSEDKVQCAFCHVIVDDWNVGQQPLPEHIKNSPMCSFYSSSNVGNVPFVRPQPVSTMGDVPINSSNYKPKNPRMSSLKERLGTYKFCHWPLQVLITQQLAKCGFYYTGDSWEDKVTCFFCGGSLGNWGPNDDPWFEHTKFFPHCAYLNLVTRQNEMLCQNSAPMHQAPVILQPETHQPGASSIEHEFIKEACNIFPKSVVEIVVLKHLKEKSCHYTSSTELCKAIWEYEISSRVSYDVTGYTIHNELNIAEQKSEIPCSEPPVYINGTSSNTDEENQQLSRARDSPSCKICMDREFHIIQPWFNW